VANTSVTIDWNMQAILKTAERYGVPVEMLYNPSKGLGTKTEEFPSKTNEEDE
jgi:hypothetical protein